MIHYSRGMFNGFVSCRTKSNPQKERFIPERHLFSTLQGYTAICRDTERDDDARVCIKGASSALIRAGKSWDGTRVREDFLGERRLLAKISAFEDVHPFICKSIEEWDTPDEHFYAMEYCPNGSLLDFTNNRLHGESSIVAPKRRLSQYMAENPRSVLPNECLYPRLKIVSKLTSQIVDVMSWLHGKSMVHLDLSLENILMGNDDLFDPTIKLIDFGVGLDLSDTVKTRKNGRQVWLHDQRVGKSKYMAPEVVDCRRSKRPYDVEAADIFTIGSMLYMMVCGHYPSDSLSNAIRRGRAREWLVHYGEACLFTWDAFDCLVRLWMPESSRILMEDLKNHPFIKQSEQTQTPTITAIEDEKEENPAFINPPEVKKIESIDQINQSTKHVCIEEDSDKHGFFFLRAASWPIISDHDEDSPVIFRDDSVEALSSPSRAPENTSHLDSPDKDPDQSETEDFPWLHAISSHEDFSDVDYPMDHFPF